MNYLEENEPGKCNENDRRAGGRAGPNEEREGISDRQFKSKLAGTE